MDLVAADHVVAGEGPSFGGGMGAVEGAGHDRRQHFEHQVRAVG